MTRSELERAERTLRKDDNAIRLRFSATEPFVFIERKVRRGRIGTLGPGGLEWEQDAGRRYEEGHALVGHVHLSDWNLNTVRYSLRAADTWRKWDRNAKHTWQMVEEQDARRRARQKVERQDKLRYKASEFYDRYAWTMKSRVSVPGAIS